MYNHIYDYIYIITIKEKEDMNLKESKAGVVNESG